MPLYKIRVLQNPNRGSLKCTLKKYPLKPLQNRKNGSDCYPKLSLYKMPNFRVMCIYPKKALLRNGFVQPPTVRIL